MFLNENQTRSEYDPGTAVTFLLAGLALGAIVGVVFSALHDSETFRLQPNPSQQACDELVTDQVLFE
jgi:predicted ribosomally synthesized peptide with SipW-like signal peptide